MSQVSVIFNHLIYRKQFEAWTLSGELRAAILILMLSVQEMYPSLPPSLLPLTTFIIIGINLDSLTVVVVFRLKLPARLLVSVCLHCIVIHVLSGLYYISSVQYYSPNISGCFT